MPVPTRICTGHTNTSRPFPASPAGTAGQLESACPAKARERALGGRRLRGGRTLRFPHSPSRPRSARSSLCALGEAARHVGICCHRGRIPALQSCLSTWAAMGVAHALLEVSLAVTLDVSRSGRALRSLTLLVPLEVSSDHKDTRRSVYGLPAGDSGRPRLSGALLTCFALFFSAFSRYSCQHCIKGHDVMTGVTETGRGFLPLS